ncbi:neural-cadherin [Tachysurus ichikawai]
MVGCTTSTWCLNAWILCHNGAGHSLISHLRTNLAGPLSSCTMTLARPVTASPNIIKANGFPLTSREELHIQLLSELRHSLISHALFLVYPLASMTTLIHTYPLLLEESHSITGQYTLCSKLLKKLLLKHRAQLQSFLQVNVTQVHVDECAAVDCSGGGGCMNRLSVSERPSVVDSDSMALVSVSLESTAVCSCSAREHLHQGCSTYPRNPCHNGGVCVDTQNGYRALGNLGKFHQVI